MLPGSRVRNTDGPRRSSLRVLTVDNRTQSVPQNFLWKKVFPDPAFEAETVKNKYRASDRRIVEWRRRCSAVGAAAARQPVVRRNDDRVH